MSAGASREAFLICTLARLILEERNVAVGASSPIPASAALLAQAVTGGRCRAMILGSRRHGPFVESGSELFDRTAQGRVDVFFLSGGQIDGAANLNLVGVGPYPRTEVRFPGSFGSAFMYMMAPRTILFREEHSPRVLVPKVDFVSAPGVSPPGVYRRGGPTDLVTGMAAFTFDRDRARFALASVHPSHTVAAVTAATGFAFDRPAAVPTTPEPDPAWIELIRTRVAEAVAETYPGFARAKLGHRRPAA